MKFLIGLLASLLFATLAAAQVVPGKAPPDALGVDNNKSKVHVSDYRGKVVVVTFWASWCGACLTELPILEKLQRRLGDDQIRVIAVNTDTDPVEYRKMIKRMKDYQLTFTADFRSAIVARNYNVQMLPYMILIDRTGHVAHMHSGYGESMLPKLVDEINGLLDEPPAQLSN